MNIFRVSKYSVTITDQRYHLESIKAILVFYRPIKYQSANDCF